MAYQPIDLADTTQIPHRGRRRGIRSFTRKEIQARYRHKHRAIINAKEADRKRKRRSLHAAAMPVRQLKMLCPPKPQWAYPSRRDPLWTSKRNEIRRLRYAADSDYRKRCMERALRRQAKPETKLARLSYLREWTKKKCLSDDLYRMRIALRRRIWAAFRNHGYTKKSSVSDLLGNDFVAVKAHIEKTFKPGMTWANHGMWHIDHIIPLHVAKSHDELILLFHFTNLRALWAKENLSRRRVR
jgi:hypothetical protein